jgi:hypothetical protein
MAAIEVIVKSEPKAVDEHYRDEGFFAKKRGSLSNMVIKRNSVSLETQHPTSLNLI